MCGIAGWIGAAPDDPSVAARMADLLRHRGPDDHGIRAWTEATLVHTRLSILDLSPLGAQPMSNEDGTVWTVFNGEIYNHGEIRRELERRGHHFRGHSDTEIIPHLYEEEGADFAHRLRGMFAIAVYDQRQGKLVLTRDRFGIKPLFYAPGARRLGFASEIRALRELPDIDVRPDRQAIYDFAALFYIPAPETFYRGIRALEPGETLVADLDTGGTVTTRVRRYHHWTLAPDPDMTVGEAVRRTEPLLETAVCRQMESDVPLGSLLSGGIDSSLVSVGAQAASGGALKTFNVRFAEKGYDETWAAVAVARHIGSEHQTLDLQDYRGDWETITGLLRQAGQPFADTSIFAVNAVSRLMRQHVTVALSGDGGDEGFGGYESFARIAGILLWQRLPAPIAALALKAISLLARRNLLPAALPDRLRQMTGVDDSSIIQTLACWIRDDEHRRLCRDKDLMPVRRWFENQWEHRLPRRAGRLEKLSAQITEVNARLRLPNDFLCKVDTASMKESLEVRVPLLDEDLFAFGLTLPHRLKVKGRQCKRVLRAVSERQLPPEVARKPKHGFETPVDAWIGPEFRSELRESLLSSNSGLDEFFEPDVYRPMVEAFCDQHPLPGVSRAGLYQRAIMLLSVRLAMERG